MKYTKDTIKILDKQEQVLHLDSFGAKEALALGNIVAELAPEYPRGISVKIIRESDGLVLFAYAMDDKAPRNEKFLEGKRQLALASGHSSFYVCVAQDVDQRYTELYPPPDKYCFSGGGFPLFVDGQLTASLTISGLHEGKDYELGLRALSKLTGLAIPEILFEMI